MKFVNLTPHDVTIHGTRREAVLSPNTGEMILDDLTVVQTLPSAGVARVDTVRVRELDTGTVSFTCRVIRQTMGEVTGLPDPVDGVAYIVSAVVLAALGGSRPDVFAPDTGPDAIRENGQIVAVRGLVQ